LISEYYASRKISKSGISAAYSKAAENESDLAKKVFVVRNADMGASWRVQDSLDCGMSENRPEVREGSGPKPAGKQQISCLCLTSFPICAIF
jgi:hypothetical protein